MERIWLKSYDSEVPHDLTLPDEPLPLLVQRSAHSYPDRPATEFIGAKLKYRDLWDQTKRMAAALHALGVKRETRVAIMVPNCPQAIIAYYATLWLGGIAVMTNPMYVEREMEHQWDDAGAEILVVLDHLYPRVRDVVERTPVRKVIVTSIRDYLPFPLKQLYPLKAKKQNLFMAVPYGDNVLSFIELIKGNRPTDSTCPISLDDIALLQYTGGTTGVAKGVMLTHRNIMANVAQIVSWFPQLRAGKERFMAILPFFHVFGMTVAMNLPLYSGSTAILVPRFEAGEFIKVLHKSKPTIFPGVPTIYVAIVNHPKIKQYDLSSIRFCITGSAPMPVEIIKQFEEMTGAAILEGYGLSEASPVTHVNPIEGVRKPGSIGIALPGTDYKIMDIETGTQELDLGEEGELVVRGPQVMKGYWNMPEETEATLRDGWLYTGDIGKMDEDGYVFIVDRKKDMIIAGGYNIYPREVDEILYEHPKILDAVTVGVPDPYRGETVKAFVVPKPGEDLTEEEVIRFCKEKLASYKVPKAVEMRESLPKTIVGKVLRKELRAEAIRQQESS